MFSLFIDVLVLRWGSALSPFWVEPLALPCGSPYIGLPNIPSEIMPLDLPCSVALDFSKFPATASPVDISSAF